MRKSTAAGIVMLISMYSAPTWPDAVRVGVGSIVAVANRGEVSASGELSAIRTAVISAEIAGAVAEIQSETGDAVARNALLAAIRDAPAQLDLRAAKGRVAQADAEVERARINERRLGSLLQRKALSQDEYDTARVELGRALAVLETSRAEEERTADDVSRHQLRAPFAGTIVKRHIELGQWLDVGDPCFVIEDTSMLRAKLSVPQRYFDEVSVGAAAQIRFDAVPGKVYNAAVSRKPPLVRSAGRSFEVWLDIDNPAQQLVPGLSLQASLTLDAARSGQLGVPRDAVVRNQGGTVWLWVVEGAGADGSVRRVEVEVAGASSDGLIIRAEGLAPGMRVVTRGNESLREGQAVSVVGER